MENNSKSGLTLFIILILIIVVLIYLFSLRDRGSAPIEVLTSPEGYEEGTTLSLYENAPASFPAGIILESKKLDHSSVITLPDGKTQTKVAYTSEKSVIDLANMHKTALLEGGWQIEVNANNENFATIVGEKEEARLTITIVKEDAGTVATFQYEK